MKEDEGGTQDAHSAHPLENAVRNQHAIKAINAINAISAISAHPNGQSSTAARNQHAINMQSTQSAQSARTQMVSPRPQLDGLAVAEAPVGKRAPC